MPKKNKSPMLGKMLQKIAPKIGAKVLIEPQWGIVTQITFKNGKKSYTRYNTVNLNPMGSSEIAKDKDYANFFMKSMGYPTITGKAFYSDEWARAIGSKDTTQASLKYAIKIGFPLIIKPNSKSQGVGVALVYDKTELYRTLKSIFKIDKVALVQKYIKGKDYRIVILDKKVISAYERLPLRVTGDGKSTIEQILNKKKKHFGSIDRDIKINSRDPRIKDTLKHQDLHLSSILPKGEIIPLLTNANLSTGGDSIDVTSTIHSDFKKIAVNLTRDMGLRLCGVDLMIDGDISEKVKKYWVIEVNSAPGLDHYVTTGKAQKKIVEDLYLEVLKSMEK